MVVTFFFVIITDTKAAFYLFNNFKIERKRHPMY